MPIEPGPQFLKQKYDLHNKPEVKAAARRTEVKTGERLTQDPYTRIENYLDSLANIFNPPLLEGHEHFDRRKRNITIVKPVLHDKLVIKPDKIPESYWDLQRRIIREEGREADFPKDSEGKIEIPDNIKEQIVETLIEGQTASLDKWIDYLTSDDAAYPNWAKYWAIRSILEMGKLIKEEREDGEIAARFGRRTVDTVAPFPPLNPRALALTIGVLQARLAEKTKPKAERQPIDNQSIKLDDEAFQALLATEDFSKLYTQFLIEIPEYSAERLQETRGRWVKYDQGSDPTPLVASLEGYPLEWCTADLGTASHQLQGGDFYVYYSINDQGEAKIPRAAIRMEQDKIAEVRGIAPEQNLDPFIADVVREKMKEFPDGSSYEKKAYDMQMLTYIERKTRAGQQLNKNELVFLYEINGSIEGFGYASDPRIYELRTQRDPAVDAPIVFECQSEEIAHAATDITETTKAYIGQLEPGIFDRLPKSLEHIYTSFPEGKIRRFELTIGGKSKEQLINELQAHNSYILPEAEDMIKSPDFTTLENSEQIDLVRLKVADLGFTQFPTTAEIIGTKDDIDEYGNPAPFTKGKMTEFDLELCPAEVGPYQQLQDVNQPLNERCHIAMKPIADRDGRPHVFRSGRDDFGPWLDYDDLDPTGEWGRDNRFVFRVRPPRRISPS